MDATCDERPHPRRPGVPRTARGNLSSQTGSDGRNRSPPFVQNLLPPVLEAAQEPFVGITTDGRLVPDLFARAARTVPCAHHRPRPTTAALTDATCAASISRSTIAPAWRR